MHIKNNIQPMSPGRCALPKWPIVEQVYSMASKRQQGRQAHWWARVKWLWPTTRSSSPPTSISPKPTAHPATSMRRHLLSSSSKHSSSSRLQTTEGHRYQVPVKRGQCRPSFQCMTNESRGQRGEITAAIRKPGRESAMT
jgi:hypothetical protein